MNRRDMALEYFVDLVHPGPHLEPFAWREDLAGSEHSRVLPAAVRLEGDAQLIVETAGCELATDDPIEPVMVVSSAKIVSEPQAT